MEILEGVIPCVTNEGVRVRRAAHEEFVCEVVYELADWVRLEVSVKIWYESAPGKVPYNTEAFWLIDLQMTIIG